MNKRFLYNPVSLFNLVLGRGQAVRHQVLVLAFGGSNPSALASFVNIVPVVTP